jgi:hypothetical protein
MISARFPYVPFSLARIGLRATRRVSRSLIFLACFLSAAISAAAPPQGAWTGTLGKRKIAACFDESDAIYYYFEKGIDIVLSERADGAWEELAGDRALKPGTSTGTWRLQTPQGKHLTGSWSSPDGKRVLPITLTLATKAAAGASCPLPGYVAPRVNSVVRTPSDEHSIAGLKLRAFRALSGAVVGLELVDDTVALAPAKKAIESHNQEMLEGYFECLSLSVDHSDYRATIELAAASEHWLVLVESLGQDCGYAHPNWGMQAWTIERSSGTAVDIAKWLNAPLVDIGRKYFKWTRTDYVSEEDCVNAINELASFSVWPTAKGLVFFPELPHVIAVCGQPYVVPYPKLERYLTPAGRAAVGEISRSAPVRNGENGQR